ncbi:unnamed protein product [Mytilus coruscus]|uniref:MEGF10_11 n=1 Tax=Mytilus coruscus TaxID=42192 RepID=A0A6J8F1H1_MYTCO|nr:unnamed protein product [Mytilus coruscus]
MRSDGQRKVKVHLTCDFGVWGGSCQYTCSSTCFYGTECSSNCVKGVDANKCKETVTDAQRIISVTSVTSTGCKTNNTKVARCFPNTGNCRFGCSAGWNRLRCDKFTCSLSNCQSWVVNQPTVCERYQVGLYIDSGQCIRCNVNCATLNSCNKTSGTCTGGCKTGWYGNKCKDNCTTNCFQGKCDTNGICTVSCNSKRYGQKCDLQCYNCLTTCNRNTGLCDAGCVDGYHECDQTTAACIGKCIDGFCGTNCNKTCSMGCLRSSCDKQTGKCSICKEGYYEETCSNTCSNNCKFSRCNKTTGLCSEGCSPGKFGELCDSSCSSCTLCNQATGTCEGCAPDNFITGWYGAACNLRCSENCNGDMCDRDKGECTYKCTSGFYSTQCKTPCISTCTYCEKLFGTCTKCNPGYYGHNCQSQCSSHCSMLSPVENIDCNKLTGICNGGCATGWYECNIDSGKCSQECVVDKYGEYCEKNCTNCAGTSKENCNCGNGICLSETCFTNCLNNMCDQKTGFCTSGCKSGWFGQKCKYACLGLCSGNVCDQVTGSGVDVCA